MRIYIFSLSLLLTYSLNLSHSPSLFLSLSLVPDYYVQEREHLLDGKLEKSFLTFASNHPGVNLNSNGRKELLKNLNNVQREQREYIQDTSKYLKSIHEDNMDDGPGDGGSSSRVEEERALLR